MKNYDDLVGHLSYAVQEAKQETAGILEALLLIVFTLVLLVVGGGFLLWWALP